MIHRLYNDFYTCDIETVKINYIYINENNELTHINNDIVHCINLFIKLKNFSVTLILRYIFYIFNSTYHLIIIKSV